MGTPAEPPLRSAWVVAGVDSRILCEGLCRSARRSHEPDTLFAPTFRDVGASVCNGDLAALRRLFLVSRVDTHLREDPSRLVPPQPVWERRLHPGRGHDSQPAVRCDIIEAATAEESGASPERSRHCDPDVRHLAKIREVRTSAAPVVVASRVRRPDPDMPRAWTPAGRV